MAMLIIFMNKYYNEKHLVDMLIVPINEQFKKHIICMLILSITTHHQNRKFMDVLVMSINIYCLSMDHMDILIYGYQWSYIWIETYILHMDMPMEINRADICHG